MKIFVVAILSSLAIAVQCGLSKDEVMTTFRSLSMSCKEQTGATDADIETLMRHEPAGSMEAKCLGACIMKKIDVMDANGKFVKDVAMKIAELHTQGDTEKLQVAEEAMDICKSIAVSDNHCEAAEQYGLCMKDEAVKRGINTQDF